MPDRVGAEPRRIPPSQRHLDQGHVVGRQPTPARPRPPTRSSPTGSAGGARGGRRPPRRRPPPRRPTGRSPAVAEGRTAATSRTPAVASDQPPRQHRRRRPGRPRRIARARCRVPRGASRARGQPPIAPTAPGEEQREQERERQRRAEPGHVRVGERQLHGDGRHDHRRRHPEADRTAGERGAAGSPRGAGGR